MKKERKNEKRKKEKKKERRKERNIMRGTMYQHAVYHTTHTQHTKHHAPRTAHSVLFLSPLLFYAPPCDAAPRSRLRALPARAWRLAN
jgi:hypothetical protein